jgi:hypothetical protein
MIQGQFGSTFYSSGTIDPLVTLPAAASADFLSGRGILSVDRRNDQFYVDSAGNKVQDQLHYMTFDYIDLRDLMKDQHCMDDVTINVQRLRENPLISSGYNLPPANGIEETLLFVLGDLSLDTVADIDVEEFCKAGFAPVAHTIPTTLRDMSGTSLPFQVLYREVRRYMPDNSQTYFSTNQIGSFANILGDPASATTSFCGNLVMTSRTIGGYPDLIVGPGITVIRVVSAYLADRGIQAISGNNVLDVAADQLTYLSSRLAFTMPALQYNVVGTQREMTDTEIATYYSNILVNQQSEL